jgi:hypothetical protein
MKLTGLVLLSILMTACASRSGYYDGKKYTNTVEQLPDALSAAPQLLRVNGDCLMVMTLKTGKQVVSQISKDVCKDAVMVDGLARSLAPRPAPQAPTAQPAPPKE